MIGFYGFKGFGIFVFVFEYFFIEYVFWKIYFFFSCEVLFFEDLKCLLKLFYFVYKKLELDSFVESLND